MIVEPELFDTTFGSLGGYAEPAEEFKEPVTAEKAWQTTPNMLQQWLFFGRRLSPDTISTMGSLDGFVDECIRVFDVICDAGYYDPASDICLRMKMGMLLQEAALLEVSIGKDVACYVAIRVTDNISDIKGALRKIEALARFHNRSITVDLAKEALKDIIAAR